MSNEEDGRKIIEDYFREASHDDRIAFEDMNAITCDYLFGEIWTRPELSLRDRSVITLSILVATGKERQLRNHLLAALRFGLSPKQLKELMIHAAHYSGWPSGMNGLRVLQDTLDERGLKM